MSKEASVEVGEEVGAGDDEGREREKELEGREEVQFPTTSTFIPGIIKDHWADSSKLLFQAGYLQVLKQMALSGQLQQYNIRSVCWKLFLGCLPEDQRQWEDAVKKTRNHYSLLKKKHIIDPHAVEVNLDVTLNNPLSLAEDNPWNRFFQGNDSKQLIRQDVVGTFPDVQFFKQEEIQHTMLDILFCYAREHEDLGYRQGMHELLAPILFVLHTEMRDPDDNSMAPVVKTVMDQNYIEHDAYTIFTELMESMQVWYQSSALEADYYRQKAQNKHKKMALDPRTHQPFRDENAFIPSSAITRKLDKIHTLLLKNADEVLYVKLKELAIPAQTYGIRWIRLLFGREFPLPSVLEMWDALFADGPSLGLMDYIFVAMLMHIREVLIEGDYAVCMQHLMHFPPVYDVNYFVQRALHLRNTSVYPSPLWWTYHPSRNPTSRRQPSMVPIPSSASHPLSPGPTDQTGNIQESLSNFQTKASKVEMSGAYEPKPRIHHYVASVGKKCYMYGGTYPNDEPPSFVEVFDLDMKTWTIQLTENSPSDKRHTRGACCSLQSGDIYFYGGFIAKKPCDHLYKLMITQMGWIKLLPRGDDRPIKKGGCQMVVFHKTKIALYGGQSHRNLISSPQQLSRTVQIGRTLCITNELHLFDTLTGDWSFPLMKGIALPHNSYFSFTAIDDHRALIFGGNIGGRRLHSLYLIDFNIMEITELKRKGGQLWPAARDEHGACCLGFGSENPQLLIVGGIDAYDKTIGDAWIFDLSSQTWTEIFIPEYDVVLERFGHSATAIPINPSLIEVAIVGGCLDLDFRRSEEEHLLLLGTIVLKFELRPDKQWILLPVVGSIKELYLEAFFLDVVQGMIEDAMDKAAMEKKGEIVEIEQIAFTNWANMTDVEKVKAVRKYSSKSHEADHCLLTPVEYRALHIVFSAYNNKKIMDAWQSVYHMRVVTLHIVMQLLRSKKLMIVARDLKGKFDKVLQKVKAQEAYEHALSSEQRLKMTYLKFIAFGLPRSGKSSTFRRLIGEIVNLQQLGGVSRSTGVAECKDVIIKPFKSVPAAIVGSDETASIWESLKKTPVGAGDKKFALEIDQRYLAHLFFHIISKNITENSSDVEPVRVRETREEIPPSPAAGLPQAPVATVSQPIQSDKPAEKSFTADSRLEAARDAVSTSALAHVLSSVPTASELKVVEAAIKELSSILQSDSPEEFQMLLEKLIMINMMDVGGQPGFVEMLPAFTTGSALYFLFFRLDQEIRKLYPVRFLAADSVEEVVLESSYCIQDVLCQLVSSISCFESFTQSLQSSNELKSRALLFGTFKDQIKGPDKLENRCKEVEATLWKILSSMQEDLLLEADQKHKFFMIDNMHGNDDIESIRKTIEEIIRSSFSQTEVPPSWLMFRILLILIGKPVVSLGLCRALASRLEMPTPVEDAIQFFHYNIGSLMYYPEVKSVKDLVICDPQVIFDSISELVIDTFSVANRANPRSVRKEFESKGFFTLKHIESTTQKKRKSYLTPRQLIYLLKHLGISAEIQPEQPLNSDNPSKFIIPAVLKNASETELISDSSYKYAYSIMVHFDCGFMPYGIFCFVIARLISSRDTLSLPLKLHKDLPIRKNRVVFLVDGRFDVVLISRPQYLEIQLGQCSTARKKAMSIEDICPIVREQIVLVLSNVITEMKYKLSILASESEQQPFSMAFPCSKEGHMGHLMRIVEEKDQSPYAQCLKDDSEIDLLDHNQLIWFGGAKALVHHDDATASTYQLICTSNYSGTLNIDHLAQVQLAIWEGRTEWKYLGLELRLSPETLKSIEKNHPQSIDDCFLEMLSEWLRSSKKSTWEDLIAALRSPIVGLQSLASELENKLGKIPCDNSTPANDFTIKDSGILNINHLVHVIHAIWEARTEWSSLGLQLGLTSVTLEAIGMAQHQSVKDCFLEMLSEWLRSGHKPSWKTLTSALIRSPSVRLHSLANLGKIRHDADAN